MVQRTSLVVPQAHDETSIAASWERFVEDDPLPSGSVRRVVLDSWRRSRRQAVDPGRAAAPIEAGAAQVARLRERHQELWEAARPVLKRLRGVLRESGSLVVLTDPDGIVLDASGGSLVRNAAERINLAPGGRWVEGAIGTNAIGTAISRRKAVQIYATEHYCLDVKRWTCAAAPILDPLDQRLRGVLDVSGLKDTFHGHTLGLVIAAAQQIEAVLARRRLEEALGRRVQSQKLDALGNLVVGVAHVLNTPLGNSLMAASTLASSIDEFARELDNGALRKATLLDFVARCREAARLVERSTGRAADLIGHFKELAVDPNCMARARFDLRRVLEEALHPWQRQLSEKGHRLELRIPPGIVLDSFPDAIRQVTDQLVRNSLAHGLAGIASGTIAVAAEGRPDGPLVLRYSDDGVGISETIAARIFDPFFTTGLGAGDSGLGLYIVHTLVTAVLGGSVELASAPGRGAVFSLRLPRVAPEARAEG